MMCGICGRVRFAQAAFMQEDLDSLHKMNETLAPRGPDQQGIWHSQHAIFAHRRLSVMDPASGRQPMIKRDGQTETVLVYNGELYNAPELRNELIRYGYRFETACDTEVLLLAYHHWGAECLDKLNGIFAFAVWDGPNNRFFAARDRVGVKPFFYTFLDGELIFASEIKALLAHPGVIAHVDAEGIMELFMQGPARHPGKTPFKNIQELSPGQCITFSDAGFQIRTYWALTSGDAPSDEEEAAEWLGELLEDTVRRQLQSDVPLGFFLSGGLDSGLLTTMAAGIAGPSKTFSIDFPEQALHFRSSVWNPERDEDVAIRMAGQLGALHHTIMIGHEQLAAHLSDAMLARDLPGMADVDTSLMLFCKSVKSSVTVAWSGEGADEIFGGYPWYRQAAANFGTVPDSFPWNTSAKNRRSLIHERWRNIIDPDDYAANTIRDAWFSTPDHGGETEEDNVMRKWTYLNLTRFMPVLLERKDRMSMACGLEVRVPFCDHRIVEFGYRLPWRIKCAGGREKGILRKTALKYMDQSFVLRKKNPFPKIDHPAYAAVIRHRLKEITERDSALFEVADRQEVLRLLNRPEDSGNYRWFGQLMGPVQWYGYLIQLNNWLETYQVKLDM